ncbi:Inosine/uridine-preferring nucleoside hydrolase domain-containing protein [Lentinula edodes]|uniref:Inosine/uridine-preferring nucleoside hydrolase domain-containing protein n=1 Tax=Lentinula lateritia TaxID=40482 RepID=A0A9W9DZS9_9AGAR|nr:Inosine/uridine-preferring nucleoside hydrolase domain-containing protein [Lentinula edodes]
MSTEVQALPEHTVQALSHAAQIVLDAPVPAVMIPINITHTAIVTRDIHRRLLSPSSIPDSLPDTKISLPEASTPLRHTLSTLISFFADSYKSTFGFNDGPPLHDALTIAYVAHPELFTKTQRYRVDVELSGVHTIGETVVDVWDYRGCGDDSWASDGKNCIVTQSLDVVKFFDIFLDCVSQCDTNSPLNK